jgi:hypothetical protein
MNGKLQDTFGLKAHFGNAEGTNMLFNINHLVIAIKENQIQGVHHTNGVNAVGRDNPKAFPRPGPPASCAQKTHEPAEVTIRNCGMRGNKALAGLIVDTNVFPSIKGSLAHW